MSNGGWRKTRRLLKQWSASMHVPGRRNLTSISPFGHTCFLLLGYELTRTIASERARSRLEASHRTMAWHLRYLQNLRKTLVESTLPRQNTLPPHERNERRPRPMSSEPTSSWVARNSVRPNNFGIGSSMESSRCECELFDGSLRVNYLATSAGFGVRFMAPGNRSEARQIAGSTHANARETLNVSQAPVPLKTKTPFTQNTVLLRWSWWPS